MAIEFLCPACQGTLSMPDDSAGRLVRCGNCMTALRVPDAPPSPPPPPPPTLLPPPPPKRRPPADVGDRDEHGEPRPRRSKRKPRRSPLFWVVVVLLTFGFLTCLTCGGGMLILAVPRWKPHQSEKGGFKIDFPAKVNPNIAREAHLQLKPGEFVEGTMLVGRAEFYWVWYKDIPDRNGVVDDERLLDESVQALVKDGMGTVMRETPKNVDGFAARELIIIQENQQVSHCLIVLARTRLYLVAVSGPMIDTEGNERIRHFFDSFKIVNPNPNANPWRGNPIK